MPVILFGIAVIVLLVIFGPLVTIYALNTLFGLGIPVTLGTWFSAFWLAAIVGGSGFRSSSKGS